MGVVVVVSVLIAIAAIVAAIVTARRLAAQRAATAAAEARSTEQAAELAAANTALEDASREKAAAEERAVAAEEATTLTAEQAELAAQRASAAEAAEEQARLEAETAAEAQQAAEDRAAAAERRVVELAADRPTVAGLDADVLWTLEQARSERAWRMAMAPGPDAESVFTGTADPLLEALQVELDAAREEVGAVIELEADVPAGLTPGASVLALRAAQELLAVVVRRAEETTLRLWVDGDDLLIAVQAVDDEGQPVQPAALPLPPSLDIETTADGVRIRNAVAPPPVAEV